MRIFFNGMLLNHVLMTHLVRRSPGKFHSDWNTGSKEDTQPDYAGETVTSLTSLLFNGALFAITQRSSTPRLSRYDLLVYVTAEMTTGTGQVDIATGIVVSFQRLCPPGIPRCFVVDHRCSGIGQIPLWPTSTRSSGQRPLVRRIGQWIWPLVVVIGQWSLTTGLRQWYMTFSFSHRSVVMTTGKWYRSVV